MEHVKAIAIIMVRATDLNTIRKNINTIPELDSSTEDLTKYSEEKMNED